MRLRTILTIPLALAADVVTLGNMGEESFTEKVFNEEKREQRHRQEMEALRLILTSRRRKED